MKIKLSELRKIIREEALDALNERKIVREQVRHVIEEALPKLGTGKRFQNLVHKLATKEATDPQSNEQPEGQEGQPETFSSSCLICKNNLENGEDIRICQPCKEEMKNVGVVDENYHVRDPKRLAAWIGMKKYGKDKMMQMAHAARAKHQH